MSDVMLWQKIEGAVLFVAGLGLFAYGGSDLAWWVALLIFFAPDLSFAGYAFGPKIGAIGYNLVHLYAFGAVFLSVGLVMSLPVPAALGALWLAHVGFDRMLGYGLKSKTGFKITHLGRIGGQG